MNTHTSRRLPPPPPTRKAVQALAPEYEEEDLFADIPGSDELESVGFEEVEEGDEPFSIEVDDSDDMDGLGMNTITPPRLPPQPPCVAAQGQGAAFDEGGLEDGTGSDANIYPLARVHHGTRPIHATSVVTLMQSIAEFGVVSPVLVDSGYRIVAGAHRWAACTLLRTSADGRAQVWREISGQVMPESELRSAMALPYLPGMYLPYTVVDFDAQVHPEFALELEATENQNRKKYTRDEIRDLVQRLIEAGYTSSRGRPLQGAKPLGKCLQLFGISDAAYRRTRLDEADNSPKSGISSSGLRKKIDALHRCFERLDESLRIKASVLLDELKAVAEELDTSPA